LSIFTFTLLRFVSTHSQFRKRPGRLSLQDIYPLLSSVVIICQREVRRKVREMETQWGDDKLCTKPTNQTLPICIRMCWRIFSYFFQLFYSPYLLSLLGSQAMTIWNDEADKNRMSSVYTLHTRYNNKITLQRCST
jgi:hypothetical protein